MDLEFLGKKFDEDVFSNFVETTFEEFETADTAYNSENLSDEDKQHIVEYKVLGEAWLSDDNEIGFLLLKSATKEIETKQLPSTRR
ncbi:MAG: Unknown protein [uncultured Sulfurovum sp.]|uniref:Uncharacterized protein n=1 Tax=uncultured Sulfurovum sp. TaxID=269237 RepID=A0A6S6S2X0_9BACT|nr:MAG: Unknown protein [uncultured Sulfurovum sp.]